MSHFLSHSAASKLAAASHSRPPSPSLTLLLTPPFQLHCKMGGRNTVLLDAVSCRIPLVSDIPTIIFGADVTHPENGEDTSPSIAAVVASQDWPEVTKYTGLVCAQAHRQELIQDLYKTWHDPVRGTVSGGMIRIVLKDLLKVVLSRSVSFGDSWHIMRNQLLPIYSESLSSHC